MYYAATNQPQLHTAMFLVLYRKRGLLAGGEYPPDSNYLLINYISGQVILNNQVKTIIALLKNQE